MKTLEEKQEQFKQISDTLKEMGLKEVILYTRDGVITFGNPLKIAQVYRHCDSHFNEDVMQEIIKNLDLQEMLELLKDEHEH